ncbi:protein SHORT-ROOT 2-like [Curcuma longa]|uniref:protein SHORT-ROOT 2-like n=1 Tax=Curcuma longa TaxID=136217 RepID=UPI003D9EC389
MDGSEGNLPCASSSLPLPLPVLAASSDAGVGDLDVSSSSWAAALLLECARAMDARDGRRARRLMWTLNELSSPYGDGEQKLASFFLQGLFARATCSGPRTLGALAEASLRNRASFECTRRTALRFQELSPWSPFGHVAANAAILDSFYSSSSSAAAAAALSSLHIIDLSNTFCTQWPTLLEALATRASDADTPRVAITTVVVSASAVQEEAMREVGRRMERFARLMGVPFRFDAVHHPAGRDLSDLDLDRLVREGGGGGGGFLAVNCVNSLRGVPAVGRRRDALLAAFRRLDPMIVTVVEEEAELSMEGEEEEEPQGEAFLKLFRSSLGFFSAYLESLEESFPRASEERLSLERAAGRAVVDLVACPAAASAERRDTGARWSRRMRAAGFEPLEFSDDATDDLRALLRRYRDGWSMRAGAAGAFLAWREKPVVWASAWKPAATTTRE